MQSIINAMLNQKIWVTLQAGRKRVTVEEAIFLRLREQALKGDLKVAQFLLERSQSPGGSSVADASGVPLSQEDLTILASAGLMSNSEEQSDGGA